MNQVKKTFQQIPLTMIDKEVSLNAIYVYAKLLMLVNKAYNQTALGTLYNPETKEKKKELTFQQVSRYIMELKDKNLITITKVQAGEFKKNIYDFTPQTGYWHCVYNEFINLDTLTCKEKGFAILLSLYGTLPKTNLGLANLLKIDVKTVRKYITALKAANVLFNDMELNKEYFPCPHIDKVEEAYKEKLEELRQSDSIRVHKQLDDVDSKKLTYKWGLEKLIEIECGLYGIKLEESDSYKKYSNLFL